ncbi:restriction endonuclease subunit S [Helicobacter pylori]|uniref:restriction endonuclease subunit S n=1 Tax=Helicobacter pylori TaxID=210 RepID=UPI0013F3D8C5|nr:restriction endonuclease subunit S [Helicobacter pylori]NHB51485.1 restriction endonuclease subunit S [Helicobacter pylori]
MDALTTPSNWQKVRLGDICEFGNGGAYETLIVENGDFKLISLNSIDIDGNLKNTMKRVNFYDNSLKQDDIVMVLSDVAHGDFLGLCAVIPSNDYVLNQRMGRLRKRNDYINILFLRLYINANQKYFKMQGQGSSQLNLSKKAIEDFEIPLPPLNEQIAIANILSGLDRYLYSLDALILKKESVKKALSFELLSQRKRLKGFNQAWQRVKVKDFGIIITGSTPLTQISEYWNGTISWITPTDINDNKDIFNSERKITQKGLDTIRMIPKNSVLVTCIASIGKNAILRVNGACNQQINAIIPNKDFNADFIYYLMENNKQYLLGKAGVTATYIISKQVFEEIDFFVPKDLNEQIAIANVLSGLDHEIISLKNKKRQFENIKKALNHDLMSAKIRVLKK